MERLAGPTGQTTTQNTGTSEALGSSLRDIFAGMAMGSTPQESMSMAGRVMAVHGGQREQQQKALAHQSQTLKFLTSKGVDPGTASYLASDPAAMRAWFAESQKGQTPQWKMGEIFDQKTGRKQKIMYDERDPSRFNVIGGAESDAISPDAEAQKIRIGQASRPQTNITVGGGKFGTIPPGYELRETPEGAQMVPIPGGPAANELAEKQKKAAETSVLTKRSGDIVLEDIDKAIDQSKKGGVFGIPVTGVGAKLSGTPGTAAHDLENTLNTIKANVSFDRLQQMRQSSPTGGALGAVTPPELMLLQSTLGAVEQSQGQEQFVQNMERLSRVYKDIVHGPGANPGGGGPAVASSGKVRRYNPQTGKIE